MSSSVAGQTGSFHRSLEVQGLWSSATGGGDKCNIVGSHEKSCLRAAHLAQDLQCAQRFHQRRSFGERCQEEEGLGFFT